MDILGYPFEIYAFPDKVEKIQNRGGVYVIIDNLPKTLLNDDLVILDVGQSSNVYERISSHDRTECWERNKKEKSNILIGISYLPEEAGRLILEKFFRAHYKPPCGDR